ncbi:hypothetical protein EJ06DRAFT_426015 [Trichodelitschia bisporula]|uniref:Arb2 domain-containing protein n=1 Tax=Trichodelitschia bisporula TaxID=703511 RepID=A0A6G1HX50_9PEZI|nr:hypothetical protein EJ06DRAFT_426015 [Trichodelitschia bisporula]
MFRRFVASFPKDPVFKADMKTLGYQINEKDQIRSIEKPDQPYNFFITGNERYNEVHREALHICVRHVVSKRMAELGVAPHYLPDCTTTKPDGPHIPIFMTAPEILKTKKCIIVIAGDITKDLGIFSYRKVNGDDGIDSGTCIAVVKELKRLSEENCDEEPGVIVLNTGGLLYSWKENSAMTMETWQARKRKSAFHPAIHDDLVHNRLAGNRTTEEHVGYVFENVIGNAKFVNPGAKVYLVGIESGGDSAIDFFKGRGESFIPRVAAIALMEPFHYADLPSKMKTWLEQRARAWTVCAGEINTCVAVPTRDGQPKDREELLGPYDLPNAMCPVFSSTEPMFMELVFPTVYKEVLKWFAKVAENEEDYCNPPFEAVAYNEPERPYEPYEHPDEDENEDSKPEDNKVEESAAKESKSEDKPMKDELDESKLKDGNNEEASSAPTKPPQADSVGTESKQITEPNLEEPVAAEPQGLTIEPANIPLPATPAPGESGRSTATAHHPMNDADLFNNIPSPNFASTPLLPSIYAGDTPLYTPPSLAAETGKGLHATDPGADDAAPTADERT